MASSIGSIFFNAFILTWKATAYRRQQVQPVRGGRRRRAGRRVPEDARGALLVPRADSRQHRGRRVLGRPAPDDCRLRGPPGRQPADARRRAIAERGRVRRHAWGPRGAPGGRAPPQVTSVTAPLPPKPAATVLLNGTDERGRTQPVLTWHQFGRGRAVALTLQDTWQWQMPASISLEDQTHEIFWRQILRWLVAGVPGGVEARTASDRVEPGEPVT